MSTSRYARLPRYLYVIRGGPLLCKVGWSIDPKRRLANSVWIRQYPTGKYCRLSCPEQPSLVWSRRYNPTSAIYIERCLKHLLQYHRHNAGGEWHTISPRRAIAAVKFVLHKRCYNIQTAGRFLMQIAPWEQSAP